MKKLIISILLFFTGFSFLQAEDRLGLRGLTIDYLQPQNGMSSVVTDEKHPRFSWQLVDSLSSEVVQTAYRIVVSDEKDRVVWDSGKKTSPVNYGVEYAGSPLTRCTRYRWTLTVWDNRHRQSSASSQFETALMVSSDKDAAWGGAQWIGPSSDRGLSFYSQYLPVFRIEGTVALDRRSRSTRAGLVYGANDERLMNANRNLLNRSNRRGEGYILVELNTTGLDSGDSATLCIYRVGYKADDSADRPFATIKVSTTLVNASNRYASHKLSVASVCGTTTLELDGQQVGKELYLNPMGHGGDYIAFPMVADVGYRVPEGQRANCGEVVVRNYRLPRHPLATLPSPGALSDSLWTVTPPASGTPMLRTEFVAIGNEVARARIYATARGAYDLMINGSQVAPSTYLHPGLSQYNKTHFYQVFDVTPFLRQGKNAVGVQLMEGWWSGNITFSPSNWNFFGDRQSLLFLLEIVYKDGRCQRVVSSPGNWRYSTEGPVRLASLFQGECYDATREEAVRGWSEPGFDDDRWLTAEIVPLEGTISHEQEEGAIIWPCPDDYSATEMLLQTEPAVHRHTVLTAENVKEVRPGVWVYDMGQNMAGVPRISFRGLRPGTRVKMRYAEMVYPDLPEYKGQAGMVMMENQRSAMEQDEYVAKGGDEVFAPRGTYHGYRYVEITGVDSPVAVDQVQGVVLTSATPFATKYECSSEPVNQLFHNTCWSTLANVFSVPTDCPQRNERMGWSGDLSVFSPTMSYLIQGAPFFRKHLRALRDTQLPDGAFTSIAPIGGGFGGPLWSSVGIVLPWQSWIQYGDKRALGEHYPAMKRYADCMLNNYIDKSEGYFKGTDSWGDLGDRLGFEVNKNDNTLLFDAYCVYQLQIMEKVAKILGKTNESLQWADLWRQRARFIVSHYVDGRTGKTVGPGLGRQKKSPFGFMIGPKCSGESIDTETSYVLLLAFGILPDSLRDKVAHNLFNCVMNSRQGDNGHVYPPYSLMTGFIGTAWIADALSMVGRSDLAYKMLLNEDFPSWLYPVSQGATTVWERLNSYTKQDGFGGNNSMNSFNHYAFGSVTSWLIQHSAGICRDDSVEAFRRFIVSPEPDMTGGIFWARAEYDSQQGKIVSAWKREGNKVTYHVVIPANATAILRLQGNNSHRFVCNGRKLKMEKWRDGVYQKELGSGQYTIVAELPDTSL